MKMAARNENVHDEQADNENVHDEQADNENVHDEQADNENVRNEKSRRVDFIPRIILVFCKILDTFARFWIHVQNFGYIFMPRARTKRLFRYISLFFIVFNVYIFLCTFFFCFCTFYCVPRVQFRHYIYYNIRLSLVYIILCGARPWFLIQSEKLLQFLNQNDSA